MCKTIFLLLAHFEQARIALKEKVKTRQSELEYMLLSTLTLLYYLNLRLKVIMLYLTPD